MFSEFFFYFYGPLVYFTLVCIAFPVFTFVTLVPNCILYNHYISHNSKTTCPISCTVNPPCAAKTALMHRVIDSSRPLNVSCGIWHQGNSSSRPFKGIVHPKMTLTLEPSWVYVPYFFHTNILSYVITQLSRERTYSSWKPVIIDYKGLNMDFFLTKTHWFTSEGTR